MLAAAIFCTVCCAGVLALCFWALKDDMPGIVILLFVIAMGFFVGACNLFWEYSHRDKWQELEAKQVQIDTTYTITNNKVDTTYVIKYIEL